MTDTEFIIEPGRQDLVVKRVFDAPKDLVYQAMTEPELIVKWWGPRQYTTVVDKLDARPGGEWRFLNVNEDGEEYGFHGVYHDISPDRTTWTFEFEGVPGHVSLETLSLEESGGKTTMTAHAVYQSVDDRDAMVKSGMEEGARETYERLDELIATLR